MYNPYNWKIKPLDEDLSEKCKRKAFENDIEYYNRLSNMLGKYSNEYAVNLLGYKLAIMNLQDSLSIENNCEITIPEVDFDIESVMKKRAKIKKNYKDIKIINQHLDEIFK